ncbi:hypothetical protein CcCBS67573_g09458 [Chytriomyces confervae]|uniref:Cof-like hydrolase n=1 Tax=Chytriomyces confervae TaxID=246404 RepID=A0A507DXB5_9FUNG|nr:hypothetical protein CcCBS67573_g09458 [Chytriomyces confervae]
MTIGTIHLLALDLDGTTLSHDGIVTPRTKAAIEKVAATGAIVALCSGRSNATMAAAKASIGLDVLQVAFNGCLGLGYTENVLFKDTLSTDQVSAVLNVATQLNSTVNYYSESVIYAVPKSPQHKALIARYQAQTGAQYKLIDSYSSIQTATCKLLILTETVAEVERTLRTALGDTVEIVRDNYFVECLPARVNKGVGFTKLCKQIGMPVQNTAAFGDGINDIEFLQAAGVGVAMANAKAELKSVASRVTEFTNREDGLAIELERMLEQGRFAAPPAGTIEM